MLAIPREIPPEQYADLIRDYCREFFVSKGMIADFAIHDNGRMFGMGDKTGAVSFLQILAPELNDRLLADLLNVDGHLLVNLHIRSIDQSEAIKTINIKTAALIS